MPLFKYQAFDHSGKVVSNEIEASSIAEVKESLKIQNLFAYKISEPSDKTLFSRFMSLFETAITNKTKIQFSNQLSILLKSGVPLLEAISLLSQQFEGPFKKILKNIMTDLKEGVSFAIALEKYPKVFPNIFSQLVKAGEASGKLEAVLDRMTTFMERSEVIGGSIQKAMREPIIMGIMIIGVIIGAVVFIIPAMAKTLSQIGKELPPITQFLLDTSAFFQSYGIIIFIMMVVVTLLFIRWKNSESGRIVYHSILLKLPKISLLTKSKAVVQFSQTLGMLVEAGVDLPLALDIVNNIVDNAILSRTLKVAREEIIKEGKIAKHLSNTKMFTPVSSYMIKTGEDSNNLAKMLIKVGVDSETELTEAIDGFISAITPLMQLVIAAVVLFLILAIFLPIMQISDIQMTA